MPKKKTHKKSSGGTKYQHFRLQGSYSGQQVLLYVLADSIISFIIGLLLQPYITQWIIRYAAASSGY